MPRFEHPTPADTAAILDLWNAAFGPEWPLTERLLRQTLDHDPYYENEGCWVAREGDRVVGWVLSKSMRTAGPEVGRFQGKGGIGALCVDPDYQRQGIGGELLDRAEAFLTANGAAPNTLYFPHHLLPGIPAENEAAIAFFRKRGYEGFNECVDLKRDLADYELPAKAVAAIEANPSVELRQAREDEAEKLIAFAGAEFPGGWPYALRGHFKRGSAASDIVVAVENDEIIGFCFTADWRSPWLLPNTYWHPLLGENYGGLGPIGIGKAHRKRGLGLALCAKSVEILKQKGVQSMAIDWTTLIAFYEQMGFKVWKTYVQAHR